MSINVSLGSAKRKKKKKTLWVQLSYPSQLYVQTWPRPQLRMQSLHVQSCMQCTFLNEELFRTLEVACLFVLCYCLSTLCICIQAYFFFAISFPPAGCVIDISPSHSFVWYTEGPLTYRNNLDSCIGLLVFSIALKRIKWHRLNKSCISLKHRRNVLEIWLRL